jgi:hypothetical protein
MKKIIFTFFLLLILSSFQYSQTQLLKVGNAVEFGNQFSQSLDVTVEKVTINGKEYFKRKVDYLPWNSMNAYVLSYDRMDGDSVHYVLSSANNDSLVFNFNWKVGAVVYSYTSDTEIFEKRIDNIYLSSSLIPQDTIYIINWYRINLTTGDTMSYGDPFYDIYSKKLGLMSSGLGGQLQGAKIDGVRYGNIMPYPEEIVFSEDSLYSKFIGDTVNCFIKNTSAYDVVLDSILSTGGFYGYRGTILFSNNEMDFYLYQSYPSDWWGDTLNLSINQKDSIKFNIFDIDLCPVCKKQPDEYFEDTLKFVFSFKDEEAHFFSKIIPISGEGHLSDINDEVSSPKEFVLQQNYPNPFNPNTKIKYSIPSVTLRQAQSDNKILLKVYDVLGNEVSTLVDGYKAAGNYEVEFNGANLSSGIYFYKLRAGSFISTKKMILLK